MMDLNCADTSKQEEVLEGIAMVGSREFPRPRMSTPLEGDTLPGENLAKIFLMESLRLQERPNPWGD